MLNILGFYELIFILSILSFNVISLVGSKTILEHEPYSELLPEKIIAYFPLTYNSMNLAPSFDYDSLLMSNSTISSFTKPGIMKGTRLSPIIVDYRNDNNNYNNDGNNNNNNNNNIFNNKYNKGSMYFDGKSSIIIDLAIDDPVKYPLLTVGAWIKPVATTLSKSNLDIKSVFGYSGSKSNSNSSSSNGGVGAECTRELTIGPNGWSLCSSSSTTTSSTTTNSKDTSDSALSIGLVPDEWAFVAMVFDQGTAWDF